MEQGMLKQFSIIVLMITCLTACAAFSSPPNNAPVVNANLFEPNATGFKASSDVPFLPDHYVVQSGETLNSIANSFGISPRELAKLNRLQSPYRLHPGQVISFRQLELHRQNPADNMVIVPLKAIKPVAYRHHHAPAKSSHHHKVFKHRVKRYAQKPVHPNFFLWPIEGRLKQDFSAQDVAVTIVGKPGQKVHAIKPGVVVYSQQDVAGFGDLLIINHGHGLLAAYGLNKTLLVHQGEHVRKGQVIALAGQTRHHSEVSLELRHAGKPVNPLIYLAKK